MVLNDAGVIGLTPQRQVLPRHRAGRRQAGRLGRGPLHERGPADPPDAPARPAAARDRQGRVPAPTPYQVDTLMVAPGERYTVLVHATRARRLGVALPHPQPRRGRQRACSAWSRRSSSSDRRGPRSIQASSSSDDRGTVSSPWPIKQVRAMSAMWVVVALRRELGLSVEDVAARAGMRAQYVTYLESQPAQLSPADAMRPCAGSRWKRRSTCSAVAVSNCLRARAAPTLVRSWTRSAPRSAAGCLRAGGRRPPRVSQGTARSRCL